MSTFHLGGPSRLLRAATTVVIAAATVVVGVTVAGATSIPTAQFAIRDFATGFSITGSGVGPVGLAFDGQGRLFVSDYANGNLVRIPATGGTEAGNVVGNLNAGLRPAGLTFGKDGRLYVARQTGNDVIEVDPATGGVIRTVAAGLSCATGIATDPLTGDLFLSRIGCASQLTRIANPASATPTISAYPPAVGSVDGITISSTGTIYVEANGCAVRIDGTSVASPTASAVACVSTMDGIALSNNAADPTKPLLFTDNNNGTMTSIDTSTAPPTQTTVATGGTRGDLLTVGPDGCIYATQSTTVERVTKANGTCSWVPTSVIAQLGLTPSSYTPTFIGTSKTFTATLQRVSPKDNVDVTFTVTGPNARTVHVPTNTTGKAVFTYAGTAIGIDSIVASATTGSQSLSSNVATIRWEDATLTVPSAGTYKQAKSFSGTHFAAGEVVQLQWDGSSSKVVGTATANGTGAITGNLVVPATSAGVHDIVARGQTSGRAGYASMLVTPSAALSPRTGSPSTVVTVALHGFRSGETVRTTFDATVLTQVTATANGSAGTSFPVPATAAGAHTVTLTGLSSGLSVTTPFTVLAALRLNPTSGPAGTDIGIFAEGLPAFTTVTVRWDCTTSACAGPVLVTGTTDGAGRVTFVDVQAPTASPGAHVVGVIAGSAFGKATFTLT